MQGSIDAAQGGIDSNLAAKKALQNAIASQNADTLKATIDRVRLSPFAGNVQLYLNQAEQELAKLAAR